LFQSRYGAADSLKKVIAELKKLPNDMMQYLVPGGRGFKYRNIAKTNRLSPHSYGIAIDINTSKSNY
jgi:hypothetical protein